MKNWFTKNASKIAKGCTIAALALVICCALSVMNDWNLIHQQIGAVMQTAGPLELEAMGSIFMTIAAAKCPMFLIPAAACGVTAIVMQGIKMMLAPKAAAKAELAKA